MTHVDADTTLGGGTVDAGSLLSTATLTGGPLAASGAIAVDALVVLS